MLTKTDGTIISITCDARNMQYMHIYANRVTRIDSCGEGGSRVMPKKSQAIPYSPDES